MHNHDEKNRVASPKNRPFPWLCGNCGHKALRPGTMEYVAKKMYEGKLYALEIPDLAIAKCADCGDIVFYSCSDDQIAAALRVKLSILPPERIRRLRREAELTQADLAEHMGLAAETISRWETGALIPSRAMNRYLKLYFEVPEVRVALISRHEECALTLSQKLPDGERIMPRHEGEVGRLPGLRVLRVTKETLREEEGFALHTVLAYAG